MIAHIAAQQDPISAMSDSSQPPSDRPGSPPAPPASRPPGKDPVVEFLKVQGQPSHVVRGGNLDATLHAWSQGVVGERTFQQLTEDFADLIIPKIWDHEGRKVARVAKRLSISPKKV